MAKKIIGGIGSVLGLKKKRKAPAPAPTDAESKPRFSPKITQLGNASPQSLSLIERMRRRASSSTVLSDKLGG